MILSHMTKKGNELTLGEMIASDQNVESDFLERWEDSHLFERLVQLHDMVPTHALKRLVNAYIDCSIQSKKPTQREIGRMLNLSQSYMSRLRRKLDKYIN
jgi:DNA-binding MarR family transcriptional regulator